MRLLFPIVVATSFVMAAGLALVAASFSVTAVEENSEIVVRRALDKAAHDWAEVEANGLQVILTGTASDEATRFNALSVAGTQVDPSRIIDRMDIAPAEDLAPPRFSAEILRNDSGISIIGLIPSGTDRAALIRRLGDLGGPDRTADLLQVADYAEPQGWSEALDYAVRALAMLPRSKISVDAGRVSITAIAESTQDRRRLEQQLGRAAPAGLRVHVDIAAPRPVITPFTLRFLIDDAGARFDACSADTDVAARRILDAARAAGQTAGGTCTVGMGVPSPRWSQAAELSIGALAELGHGTVTMSDADITLIAAQGTEPASFDRVVGELESALPDLFALHAVLPEPESAEPSGPPEFTATLSPEGLVQLRGRLSDEPLRDMVDSYARAAFGSQNVYTATRIVDDLPDNWAVRVLSGLEALAMLENGAISVTPDNLVVRGVSNSQDARAEIARVLSDKLGQAQGYGLEITYRAPPEPEAAATDPEICEMQLAEAQQEGKITFEPGSATIAADSLNTMNRIADILAECGEIQLEIQGHTDSQGREEMNQQLSQQRAQSVLNELRSRRVLTSSYVAVGYGESQPIEDNDSAAGREANRRIEFRLIRTEPPADRDSGPDSAGSNGQEPDAAQEN